jgi:excisionase family DNA binding protein
MAGTERANAWMSVKSAAEYLECSERQVYRLISRGEVPAYKVGRLTRVRRVDLDRAVLSQPRHGFHAAATATGRTTSRSRRRTSGTQLRLLDTDSA